MLKHGWRYWFVVLVCLFAAGVRAEHPLGSCRVECSHKAGQGVESYWGSGTLIADDLVLTCAHGTRRTDDFAVQFGDKPYRCGLAAIDRQADLALLRIAPTGKESLYGWTFDVKARVGVEPVKVRVDFIGDDFQVCGFGPGEFRYNVSPLVAWCEPQRGLQSFRLQHAARPGDSGGGVFDSQGRLVGVVWGTVDGETYVTSGEPFDQFLRRALASRYPQIVEGN